MNNVGMARIAGFEQLTEDDWQQAWDLNVMSYVRCIRAALPALRESRAPAIVNVASHVGEAAERRDAALLGDEGGRALAVAPGRRPVRVGRDPLQRRLPGADADAGLDRRPAASRTRPRPTPTAAATTS